MTEKIPLPDALGFYLEMGSSALNRATSKLVAGFQSLFTFEEEAKLAYYKTRGIEHTKAGRYVRAMPLLDHVALHRSDDLDVMLHLGLCRIKLGQKDEGTKLLEAAYARDQANANTARLLGLAYAQAGDHERALPMLFMAATAFPENFSVIFRLGTTLDHLGRHADAIVSFERALVLRPKSAKVLRALAYALEQTGERERALACFKRADELEDTETH